MVCLGVASALPATASAAPYAPVAAYTFDEGEAAGTTLEDQAGENDGVIEGAERTVHGRYGGALSFDGTGQCATVPASPALELREELTVEAWIKPQGSGEAESIVFKEAEGEWFGYSLFLGLQANGKVEGLIANDPESESAPTVYSPVVEPDVWTHVAMTYDGRHERLYIDGVLVDTETSEGPNENNGDLRIGCTQEHETGFDGRIDEVRIYDRALNGGEVAADMEAPIQTPRQGPVAEYSFDGGEAAGTTLEDLAGEGDGAIEGATWTNGRYGGALSFDGGEDCVTVPATSAPELREELTVEAWIKPEGSGEAESIVFKEAEGEWFGYSLFLGLQASGKVEGLIANDPETESAPTVYSPVIEPNVWTHAAMTYDGLHERLYIDGELVDVEKVEPANPNNGDLRIGCTQEHEAGFDGRIDEVRIYERALGAAEVAADMESPIQTPRRSPVAEYSFDGGEAAGTMLEDLAGEDDGAIEGATWTNGRYGGALSFDGTGQCATVPASPALELREELTVEAWIKPQGSGEAESIVFKEAEGEWFGYSLFLGLQASGKVEGLIANDPESESAPTVYSPVIEPNVWTHVAMTYDGRHERLYIDGVLVDTETSEGPNENNGDLRIGCTQEHETGFDGSIDEVRIYDRVLGQADIAADMEAPIQTPKAGPVAEYAFDEDTGEAVADLSGNKNEGTVEGAEWAPGKYGSALEFDGHSSCVSVPDSESLRLPEEFTLEAWVRPEGTFGDEPLILKEVEPGAGPSYDLGIGITEGGKPEGYAEGDEVKAPHELERGVWTHLAYTYDGGRMRLFVGGAQVASKWVGAETMESSGPLRIGCWPGHEYAEIRIDEVRLYDRGLNTAEIAADMEAPIQTPKQGPIAAWSFDEIGEGNTVEDVTGDEHTATVEGATAARGKYGNALQFDGVDDVVKVPSSPDFALTEGFTLEAWVRPESESNKWAPILAKEMGGGEAAHELAWWLYEGDWNSNEPFGGTEPSPGERDQAHAADPLPVNVWSHVALTYDGAQIRLYVDGELVDCSPVPAGPPPVTGGELQIGAATEHGDYYKGRIDEVRIYNHALSEVEIQASMLQLPTVATAEPYGVEDTEALMTAMVDPNGLETTYKFQYGPTKSYGTVAPEEPEEIFVGNQPLEVEEVAEELLPETTYHYRVIAHSEAGTTVGPDQMLTTGPEISPDEEEGEFQALAAKSWKGFFNLDWSGKRYEVNEELNMVEKAGAETFRYAFDQDFGKTNEFFAAGASSKHPIRILPDLSFKRIEAKDPKTGTRKKWVEFVEESLKRYGDKGSFWANHPGLPKLVPEYWEIWNEENYGDNGNSNGVVDPGQFADLLKETHQAFERVDPGAKIMLGGLLTVSKEEQGPTHLTVGGYLHELNKAGGSPYYQALSLHPYAFKGSVHGITKQVMRNISKARKALNHVGGQNKKIWVTEIGWPVGGPSNDNLHVSVSQEKQKELLESVFERIKARSSSNGKGLGIDKAFYYNVQNNYYGVPHDWAMHCGLREDLFAVHVSNATVRGTPENGNYRKAWYTFQEEAESPFLGKFP